MFPRPLLSSCFDVGIVSQSAYDVVFYYQPTGETELNLTLMRLIDERHLKAPYYGARQIARHLRREGYAVGRKRIRRLMQKMGLCTVYQRPRTTVPAEDHEVHPYLLRDLVIDRPNQVWCADITYIPMRRGLLYLVAARIAQPPKATFVARLRPSQLPDHAARQLPDLSTTIRVEPSTDDSRLRGALPETDELLSYPGSSWLFATA